MILVPIHESNDCHVPAGSPVGGQFCGDGGLPADVLALRSTLMDKSFGPAGDGNEHLAFVVGGTAHYFTSGLKDAVNLAPGQTAHFQNVTPTMTAHTHPGSTAPSGDDAMMQIKYGIPRQVIFGEDGSWYELRIADAGKLGRERVAKEVQHEFMAAYEDVNREAAELTDAWITRTTGWTRATDNPRTYYSGAEWRDDRGVWRTRADAVTQVPGVMAEHTRNFADLSPAIWQRVEKRVHELKFRYSRKTGPYAN